MFTLERDIYRERIKLTLKFLNNRRERSMDSKSPSRTFILVRLIDLSL